MQKYITAKQARKEAQKRTDLTNEEKKRLSRRVKEIVKAGYSRIRLEHCKEFSQQYKEVYMKWFSELGYLSYYDKETDTIYTYWNAEDIPE